MNDEARPTIISYDGVMPNIAKSVFVAPSAVIVGNVTLEEESSVWFQAVIRGDLNGICIGKGTNVQDGCIIHVTH
ncbi:MAG TPA: gamma carbonic anhydrase family protein, partial [Thermosynergistes sp.]|nr:gamma carbonic anhydrase family protein [Thermosynergistes sp.]